MLYLYFVQFIGFQIKYDDDDDDDDDSRLKTYTCFTNPTPIVSLLPPGLPPRTFAWTVFSELLCF